MLLLFVMHHCVHHRLAAAVVVCLADDLPEGECWVGSCHPLKGSSHHGGEGLESCAYIRPWEGMVAGGWACSPWGDREVGA